MENKVAEVMAEQAVEISKLKKRMYEQNNALANIYSLVCCIGGPLNDNILGYTNKQLVTFSKILDEIDGAR